MKTISVVVACYNEIGNVRPLYERIKVIFETNITNYNYNILFIDNDSTDGTREELRRISDNDPVHVSAIFNVHNFGSIRSSVYGMLQAKGDCVIKMCADFQDPPELIADFVRLWEAGNKIVLGIKKDSHEKKVMYNVRKLYYHLIKKITSIDHIDNFVGYGLYDRQFVEIIRQLRDPMPYLRGIVAELGYKYAPVYYIQPERKSGKSKFNLFKYYDYAMLGITSYSKVPLRIATFLGGVTAIVSFLIGIIYLIYKIKYWDSFKGGVVPALLGVFFIGAIQLISIGLIGEYILNINTRILNRPLVVEEERHNIENRVNETGDILIYEANNIQH